MNAIIGMSDLMPQDNFTPLQKRYFQDARQMSYALLALINDILDFSKIEAGKMELFPVHYDVRALFDSLCSVVKYSAAARGIRFDAFFNFFDNNVTHLPEALYGDETRVRQVLSNVLNNAVKYTRKGSITFSLGMTAREGKRYVAAQVRDTGIGIKEKDLSRIFNSFEQLDALSNRAVQGTGLGLPIVRRLLDLMGGFIEVDSVYGRGSAFTLGFPLVAGDVDQVVQSVPLEQFVQARPEAAVRVLVVDDTAVNLSVALGFLSRHGIRAEATGDGLQSVEMVRAAVAEGRPYDLVLMDHLMPGMDGVEITALLREIDGAAGLPVVALTAHTGQGMKKFFLERGLNDYLGKPLDPAALNRVLLRWLPPEKILLTAPPAEGEKDAG